MLHFLRFFLSILPAVAFFFIAIPAFAQAPSKAAIAQSDSIAPKMKALSAGGDAAGARRMAEEASAKFKADGEVWLSASYLVSAATYAIQMGDAAGVSADYYPRLQELLALLDAVEETRGSQLVAVLMEAKGKLGETDKQDELAAVYEERAARAHGKNSEEHIEAQIRTAYNQLESGRTGDGFTRLRQALAEAAATKLHALTLRLYTEAVRAFMQNGLNDGAAILFDQALQADAINADVKELADFYLAYAEFRTLVPDPQQHFVPLYSMATNLYDKYYGRESAELIHATDKLASALSGIGQYGTAFDVEKRNYEVALKTLGEDNTVTWRIANNLADMLRGLGSPRRALDYDLAILEKRRNHYGLDHFNTLVSVNNTALNYLDLGDYGEARRYFDQCLSIATQIGDEATIGSMEAWVDYTDLVSGVKPLDSEAIGRMEALITDGNYPAILSMKAAYLLADYDAGKGDAQRQIKHLQQAFSIAADEMSMGHPLAFAGRIAIAKAKAKTDSATAAKEMAGVDRDMLKWVNLQVAVVAGRDVGDAIRAMADGLLYDYALLAESDAAMVPGFIDAARRWPSLATDDADNVLRLQRFIDPADTGTARLLDRVRRLGRIAQETFAADVEQDLAYKYLEESKVLERQLHQQVAGRYQLDRETLMNQPLPTPADLLAGDQALVQYFTTRKWPVDRSGDDPMEDTRLYAIVWRKGEAPTLKMLGDPNRLLKIDGDIAEAMDAPARDEDEETGLGEGGRKAFATLHDRLIAPVEKDLAGAETLFIVPDGPLFALPFSLLQDSSGKLLEERYTLRTLTEPEALYRALDGGKLPIEGRVVLAGGIDYTNGKEAGATPLPGTLREVKEIAGVLAEGQLKIETITGDDVLEPDLRKRLEGASVAHLATHGAYGSPQNGGASNVDTMWQSEIILARSGDTHAMRRDESDGRLYAFELMGWNLAGLDLLVLSACETGRGDEAFIGGVRGLPMAASLAGARRALLTLWPVADEGTADFMTRYYEHLKAGATYAEALRITRREAIDGKIETAKDPLVWAAFVLFEN
ncbi:CHAT domain-containing tetratricopeptide repeat protein [Oryzicola mucosus]|uniref:CHAT domain-containing protein n=1 Tax=Oryzicola mucosus TaxID=2767425 RepID=A0A8J6PV32_9HYPH|nr:CHAT domain-containing tetratricopeptide repeat protein [Oryzicola mucosus]MBD0415246.1 CHAT domain-containing protein [Oryzicola mucosus]